MARIRIYADEQVDVAIIEGLRRRGVDAWAARDAGNLGLSDECQLEYAARNRAVLFTHDPDFLVIAETWVAHGKVHWGVIYTRANHLAIGECIRRLEEYAAILEAEDMRNVVEYL